MRLSALPRMLKQYALGFQINPYKENGFALGCPISIRFRVDFRGA